MRLSLSCWSLLAEVKRNKGYGSSKRPRFDARIEEYVHVISVSVNGDSIMADGSDRVMAIASDLQKDKGVWPEFIYFYIINPRRLKDAADLLFTEVEVRGVGQLPHLSAQ
jgi:hypothetical protein